MRPAIGIIGSGPTARSLACFLAQREYEVHLASRDRASFAFLDAAAGRLRAIGGIEGEFEIASWGEDLGALARRCPIIVLATIVSAYPEVAARLAPHLTARHRLVCFSSKLGGCLEVEASLRAAGAPDVEIVETDALFACRVQEDAIWIRGIKRWTLFSGPTRRATERSASWFLELFPGLSPADHVLQRGLTDFGALAHAPTMIANMSRIDRGDRFLFYYEGYGPRSIAFLEAIEAELRRVASAYETTLVPAAELLERYYGCDSSSLLAAMQSVPNYRHSYAPASLDHRYVREDVACTLVPLRQFARAAGVATPTVDATVHIASVLLGTDFEREGRSIERWGFTGSSVREILARLRG